MNEKITNNLEKQKTDYKNSDELCAKIAEKSNGIALLSFSCGKDSICSWLMMKKHFHTIIPFYFYMVPNLPFIEKSLKYYEDFFQTKIFRLPNPNFIKQLNYGLYQPKENIKTIVSLNWANPNKDMFVDKLKEKLGLDKNTYMGVGNRATDNLQRWTAFVTNGCINENRKLFWPVFDYSNDDLVDALKKANIKLPIDYKYWQKTFDGLQYRFIKKIKDFEPESYKIIQEWFPFIDIEILRYEKN